MKEDLEIIVRGGGDLATGIVSELVLAGYKVLVLETDKPAAIRRQVSFCEAVYEGRTTVENLTAVLIKNPEERFDAWEKGQVPVLEDSEGQSIDKIKPEIVIDAIIAKKNLGTTMDMAPLTIGVGPGFEAGADVHYVVETKRGHNLGRVYTSGFAIKNTGIPGNIGGYTKERVIHSPAAGLMHNIASIGERVEKGQLIAEVITKADYGFESAGAGKVPVYATLTGLLRGLIRENYPVTEGFKIADIDPREEEYDNCFTISDKARCIAGSVLRLVCRYEHER